MSARSFRSEKQMFSPSQLQLLSCSQNSPSENGANQASWLLWGRPELRVTSQQQTPRSPALSTTRCEATRSLTRSDYGGVRTQMSTLTRTGNLSFLHLTCIKESKLHFTFNNNPRVYFAPGFNKYFALYVTTSNRRQ